MHRELIWQRPSHCVATHLFNVLYSVNTQLYISRVILYIHSGHIMATCFGRKRSSSGQQKTLLRCNKVSTQWDPISFTVKLQELMSKWVILTFAVNEMESHWVLTLLCIKNVLYWPEDDRLRLKHVAIMWPECIYTISLYWYFVVYWRYIIHYTNRELRFSVSEILLHSVYVYNEFLLITQV